MSKNYRELAIPQLIAELHAAAAEAEQAFGRLGARQLNWKPAAESWSVAQCLDHLLATNASYLPVFEAARAGRRKRALIELFPLLPGLWGKFLVGAVSPQATMKVKAPKAFQPAHSEIDPGIVGRFATQQNLLAEHFAAIERQDLGQEVIVSPAARFVTYSLLDSCRIIAAHQQRHLQQAARVMQNPAFPAG